MSTRSLAVEASGDFFYRRVRPKIRLSGRWLERAGFRPGSRVTVTVEDGRLVLTPEQPAVSSSEIESERLRIMERLSA